jgi:hypothetical protein
MIKVSAYICPTCKDTVYSRTRHDCRSCTCEEIYVDGGFDYNRIGFKNIPPKFVMLEIDTTMEELFNDWNNYLDNFGIIKEVE